MANFEQRVTTNRFNEQEILKTAIAVVNKKTGQIMPIFMTYFEIGTQLYKLELSPRNKPTKDGRAAMWCKITRKNKKTNQVFGGGSAPVSNVRF
jgi:hypothetical protein